MLLSINGGGPTGTAKPMTVFYCVHLTGRDRGNTGIQRVSRNLGSALLKIDHIEVVPVRWCAEKEAIVYAEQHFCDVMALHDGPHFAVPGRPGEPVVKTRALSCLLIPEVSHLGSHDERYPSILISKLIGDAQRRGLKSAVVFHDLLPLTHPHVDQPGALSISAFESYGLAISFADALFPVSAATEAELREWWVSNGVGNRPKCAIKTMKLPEEMREKTRATRQSSANDDRTFDFVSFGTVCKRKNQIAAMRAFKAFAKRRPALNSRFLVMGSVAPDVAAQVSYEASSSDGRIVLLGYRSDQEATRLIRQARATVFVSLAEGFGLPVVESLWLGTPCICSNFGAVAEAAAGGGCLAIDPTQQGDIEDAFDRLTSDDVLFDKLLAELEERPFRTWGSYAESLASDLEILCDGRTNPVASEKQPLNVFEKSHRGTW